MVIFSIELYTGTLVGCKLLELLEGCVKKIQATRPKLLRLSPVQFFFLAWAVILVVYLIIFFVALYPGCHTFDSNMQLGQVVSGEYTNHHPFYHTLLVKFFYDLGLQIFPGNANAALACYTVFQILVLSACFAYMLSTLVRFKVSKKWVITCLILYIILPYHLIYSATIWKDILFGGLVLVLIVSASRILY